MMANVDEILTLDEAAKFLKRNAEVLRRLAVAGKVPGAKVGGRWRFSREQLLDFVKSGGQFRDIDQRRLPIDQ